MRHDLENLINRTTAPFVLTQVPRWTGLESDAGAMRRSVSETNQDNAPCDHDSDASHGPQISVLKSLFAAAA